jgi:hypothetical protein
MSGRFAIGWLATIKQKNHRKRTPAASKIGNKKPQARRACGR